MAKLNFDIPKANSSIIKVIGIGGGGGNAVNFMQREGIQGVDFIVCNTDNQALDKSTVECKIQIGSKITGGRGVGGDPELGGRSAREDLEKLRTAIGDQTKMVFITAGMGGGTGTGAAPVVAKLAMEMDILTVGIVTYPFEFEGPKRIRIAEEGIEEMKKYVDALITIKNEKLLEMYNGLSINKAFAYADNVLGTAAKGIAEIITVPGEMNVDFEDVKAIMKRSGTAIMGSGIAEGEDRANRAVKAALDSPLLKDRDIKGAKHILLNITYGSDEVQIDELTKITNYIRQEVGSEVDMKLGHCFAENMGNKLTVTIIATALEGSKVVMPESGQVKVKVEAEQTQPEVANKNIYRLDEEVSETTVRENEQMTLSFGKSGSNDPYLKRPSEQDRLKELSFDIRTQAGLEKSENIPAFKRRNIKLNDLPHSSDSTISRFILDEETEGSKPEIKEKNTFLKDNVD